MQVQVRATFENTIASLKFTAVARTLLLTAESVGQAFESLSDDLVSSVSEGLVSGSNESFWENNPSQVIGWSIEDLFQASIDLRRELSQTRIEQSGSNVLIISDVESVPFGSGPLEALAEACGAVSFTIE